MTDAVAQVAGRWRAARATRAAELRRIEGAETFAGQQEWLAMVELLAGERRLSRFAFLAERPPEP
jgi:hypothetical protein